MGYKYRLVKEDEWRFELLPNNSSIQPVGRSGMYKTKQEAMEGMKRLKIFLLKTNFEEISYEIAELPLSRSRQYQGFFQFSEMGEMFYTTRYEQLSEVEKGIKRISKNYNAEYRNELNEVKF